MSQDIQLFSQQITAFQPAISGDVNQKNARFILVFDNLLFAHDSFCYWKAEQIQDCCEVNTAISIGTAADDEAETGDGFHYFMIAVDESSKRSLQKVSEHKETSWLGLRSLASQVNDLDYALLASAVQLYHWRVKHKYCGCCGHETQIRSDERSFCCEHCGNREYPKVHPCVIVRIINDQGQILLARSPHFNPGLYSNVAGFIDPGESAEKAVYREVQEEVGIKIKNIRYLGSQSWPFPSQIMLAFCAEHDSGEINIDNDEIEDAGWFDLDDLPVIPNNFSISAWLIHNYIEQIKAKSPAP